MAFEEQEYNEGVIARRIADQIGTRHQEVVLTAGLNPDAVQRLWQAFIDSAPGLYWSRVWAVYVLIRWCHRHGAYL